MIEQAVTEEASETSRGQVWDFMHRAVDADLSFFLLDGKSPKFATLPRGSDGRPAWETFQHHRPSHEDVETWRRTCNGGPAPGWGIVHGAVSGNLVGIDIDDAPFSDWVRIHAADALTRQGIYGRLTGSGKIHIEVRSNVAVAGTILLAPNGTKLADIRSDGQYLAAEGTIHPDTLRPYEPLWGSIERIPVVEDGREFALALADLYLRSQGQLTGAYTTNARTGPAVGVTIDLPGGPAELPVVAVNDVKGLRTRIAAYGTTLRGLLDQQFPNGVRSEPMFVAIKELLRAGNHERTVAGLLWQMPLGAKAREKGLTWARGEIARAKHAVDTDLQSAPTHVQLGLVRVVADAILRHDHFAQDKGQRLYWYGNGAFRPDGDEYVRSRTRALLDEWNLSKKWSTARGTEVAEYIRLGYAPTLWEQPPLHTLNVRNGLLDVQTRELRPHNPEHLSPLQLPVLYDPSATCQWWDYLAHSSFPEEVALAGVPWEYPAWLMLPDTSIKKAVILIGEGNNGKSVFLAALREFLGAENVSNLSLHRLEDSRFSSAQLVGKLANICPDLPSEHLASTSMFKSITGHDPITGEYKHGKLFDFVPYARLLFSANTAPRTPDTTDAFYSRWVVVPFERVFRGGERAYIPRAVLDARLASPQELSGLLNHALDVLPRLRERGLTETQAMREAHDQFREVTDPLPVWLNRNLIRSGSSFLARSTLLSVYSAECDRANRPHLTDKAFGKAIRRWDSTIEEGQRRIEGRVQWAWLGYALRSERRLSNA